MTWSELHDACEHQDPEKIISRSRSNSEEALQLDEHGSTPLHIACWSNPRVDAIRALVDAHPHAVSDRDMHGDTPLMVALSNSEPNSEVVKILLEVSPKVASVPNKEGLMPIHAACRYCPGNVDVIAMLVEAYPSALQKHIKIGDPAPRKKEEPLLMKKETDHYVADSSSRTGMSVSDLRFRARGEQVRDGAYPLHMAICSADTPLVVIEILIKEAPDVLAMTDKFGRTPLHIALGRGAPDDVIELLLSVNEGQEAPRLPDKRRGNLPIHVAAMQGCSVDVAKALLKSYPNAIHAENSESLNAFEVAVKSGHCSQDVMHLLKISDAAEDVTE